MRLNLTACFVLTAVLFTCAPGIAQAQVPAAKQSVIVFDIQLSKIRDGALYKKLGGDQMIAEMQSPGDDLDVNALDRVIGSFGYPQSIGEFEQVGSVGGNVPLEFFVRGIFSDPAAAEKTIADIEQESKVVEIDGRKYLRPQREREPQNVSICRLDPNTLEIGTDDYVMEQTRNFRTARLNEVWEKLPAYPIRFAADAETAEAFINEATDMLGQQAPPQAAVMFETFKDVSTISVAIDIEADPMIAISMTGKTAAATTTLTATLNGMLVMVKGVGKQSVNQMPSEDIQKMAIQILGGLQAKQDGNTVTLNIARPEGFDEAFIQSVLAARAAAKRMSKSNDMKQLGLAMHNYYAAFRSLPWLPLNEDQSADLSWRVRVLPFMEQQAMYEMMDLTKPHNVAPNKQFADQMPLVFGDVEKGTLVYVIGHEKMPSKFGDIIDGLSNTIAMIQAPATVGWMQPKDISIDDAIELIQSKPAGESTLVLMYDGAVISLDSSTDADQLRAMMTYNGKEIIQR